MKITKEQLTKMVRASVRKRLNEGLFDKDKDEEGAKENGEEDPTTSGQPESSQVRAVEDKLGKVSGLDPLLDKIKTASQATDFISGVVNSLDSVEQQHLEQGLLRVLRDLKNPDDVVTENMQSKMEAMGLEMLTAEVGEKAMKVIYLWLDEKIRFLPDNLQFKLAAYFVDEIPTEVVQGDGHMTLDDWLGEHISNLINYPPMAEGTGGIGSSSSEMAEGTGAMSSASSGGPILSEEGDDARGYDKAMSEVGKHVNDLIQAHAKAGNKEVMDALESLKKMMAASASTAQTQQHLTRATRRGLPPVKV
jgi:hypothetical protein